MLKVNLIIFYSVFLFCIILSIVVNTIFGYDIVYTHLFYIPIILSGIWYPGYAIFVALALGLIHIICDYLSLNTLKLSPFLRSGIFLTVAYVISRITLQRDRYYSELEILNNAMCDVVTRVDADGIIEYISPSVKKVLGYTSDELTGKAFFDLIHPEDKETIENEFKKAIETKEPCIFEHRFQCSGGGYLWVESVGTPMSNHREGINIYVFGSKDITLRKKAEMELKYISIHDTLTGLYNRLMYEEELKRLNSGRFDPVGIIICDIDGLKIINDNFGHNTGDLLLINAANILKKQCRGSDILARIGGDEFAILIQECNDKILENICYRIRKAFDESHINEIGIRLFVSVGCAIGDTKDTPIEEIQKNADENMYQEKARNRKYVLNVLGETIKTLK